MGLTKKELVEYVRMAEHNQDVAEETLKQQAENVKDWIPVVRCRDCVHWFGRDGGSPVCLKIYEDGAVSADAWQTREADDFCSYGKRKDGEQK